MRDFDRRTVLGGLAAVPLLAGCGAAEAQARRLPALATLERSSRGGRLGVFALDVGSGRTLAHRADERFLMCSTFKALLAGAVLARVDAGAERLDRSLPIRASGLPGNSSITQAHAGATMTVGELCEATVTVSDNEAANVLLPSVGGTDGLTRYARSLGDRSTRLDRTEPQLNLRAGVYDTTTPRAYAGSMQALVLGRALSGGSREQLWRWLLATSTGPRRLKAGLPAGWRVGHKTGTSDDREGYANDIAVCLKPNGSAVIVAAYVQAPRIGGDAREAMLAQVGRIVGAWAA